MPTEAFPLGCPGYLVGRFKDGVIVVPVSMDVADWTLFRFSTSTIHPLRSLSPISATYS